MWVGIECHTKRRHDCPLKDVGHSSFGGMLECCAMIRSDMCKASLQLPPSRLPWQPKQALQED